MWKSDERPQRYGWAPGATCAAAMAPAAKDKSKDDQIFIGDKRATLCADCAYALPWPPERFDRVQNAIALLVYDNPDKWEQAKARPQLAGWFVGQVMKKLNGQADPEEVFEKVVQALGVEP